MSPGLPQSCGELAPNNEGWVGRPAYRGGQDRSLLQPGSPSVGILEA